MRYTLIMIILLASLFVFTACVQQSQDTTPEIIIPPVDNVVEPTKEKFCDDSDNGVTYFVAGEVIDAEGKYIDACLTPELLREYYCLDGQMEYDDYECLYGCANAVCISDAQDEVVVEEEEETEEVQEEEDTTEFVFCGSRNSVPCPEGFACFDHPSAQREWGVCQEYTMYPEDSEFAGWIQCPDEVLDVDECPKGLMRTCALYFDTIKQRNTYKKFDSPCLACADGGTLGYKFGNC